MTNGRLQQSTRWRMHRRLAARLPAVLLVLAGLLLPSVTVAQERPRTIIEMLFGGGGGVSRSRPPARVERRQAPRKKVAPRRSKALAAKRSRETRPEPSAPAVAAVAKKPDARTILVIGDFLADSLTKGLTDIYAANDAVQIVGKVNGSSGLVRTDHYDWQGKLGTFIDEFKPAAVVVMLGSNDRQAITGLPSGAIQPRTDAWASEYGKRAGALGQIVRTRNLPLVWVGMPAFKFDKMSEDMLFLNDIYRKAAADASGEFVDVWDGFVDANGGFVYSGPDVSGQPAQLRNSDGITMTPAGADKLAFFAEKALTKVLGTGTGPQTTTLPPEAMANLQLPPLANAANAVTVAPVALNDPALDGGDQLLGSRTAQGFSLDPSPRERLVVSGLPSTAAAGRADNFAWEAKAPAVAPDAGASPSSARGSVDLKAIRGSNGLQPPKQMPSLQDAIIEDWTKQSEAEKAKAPAGQAAEAPAAETTAANGAAGTVPAGQTASPAASQTPTASAD
ncbi:SGNH/GDSL hydrolase family protein [Mangrovicella endophytica]|uniref:SGNH/GDSL hydrolase family protein n=1 Tax=Mangrovicella endophytica TaxID=2066697 RepID=UPI000C9E03C8|nr:SGNH family hydrolase [Mangrovicella endophytica]